MGFISPPTRMPWLIRLGIWLARRTSGVDLLPAHLLAWYPKAAISSAVLEGLITHHEDRPDAHLDERMLKLVRLAVSFTAGCPFCVDLNGVNWEKTLSVEEISVLQGRKPAGEVASLTNREALAIEYARLVTQTPLHFAPAFISKLKESFSEREIVILATTAAQVNYWTRLIQALGCPPQGVSDAGLYLELSEPDHPETGM